MLLTSITAALLAIPIISAQVLIDPTALPACAAQCVPLNEASTLCLPPSAPVSNDAIYSDCFCNSQFLVPLRSSPNGLCDGQCQSQEDRDAIRSWFLTKCSPGTQPEQPEKPEEPPNTTTDGPAPTSSTAAEQYTAPDGPSWISTHWQYILMIIIIIIALLVFTVLALWYKKRSDQKGHVYGPPPRGKVPPIQRDLEQASLDHPPGTASSTVRSQVFRTASGPLGRISQPFFFRSASADESDQGQGQGPRMSAARSTEFIDPITGPHALQAKTKGHEYLAGTEADTSIPVPPNFQSGTETESPTAPPSRDGLPDPVDSDPRQRTEEAETGGSRPASIVAPTKEVAAIEKDATTAG